MQKYSIEGEVCTHLRVCHYNDLILERRAETEFLPVFSLPLFLPPSSPPCLTSLPFPLFLPFPPPFLSIWHCPKHREILKNMADKIPPPPP